MKLEKIENSDLEKISGGHTVTECHSQETYLCVNKSEYDILKNAGYIINGKFDLEHLENARVCLHNNGYDLDEDVVYTSFEQHPSDEIKIKIQPYT